ncbi:MAG: hypothetical protein J5I98_15445 [Phaeodactylibacter sp.]|nr:hypothetical protein [Phaeodactylibacter sp.]
MHRFWNAGQDILECEGWVKPAILTHAWFLLYKNQRGQYMLTRPVLWSTKPAVRQYNSLDYYLTGLYASMDKACKPEGDPFDSAFLVNRYRTEYDVKAIPPFVKKVIFPVTVVIGHLLGKYQHFEGAPEPLK